MATFKIVVSEHKRADNKRNVTIRLTWKRSSTYLKTEFYVFDTQVTKGNELKDPLIKKELDDRIASYEALKIELGENIELYNSKELAEYFKKQGALARGEGIDFLKFVNQVINETSNKGTSGIYNTVKNSIVDFNGNLPIPISELNYNFLKKYEAWLIDKELTNTGINLYMRTIRALFYKARKHYNDEDKGITVIKHNPFVKYEIPKSAIAKKRNLKADVIAMIRDVEGLEFRRDVLARDVFMISFYLLGMNTVDIFNATEYREGRIIYKRTKTKSRRQDEAIMSVKVIPEMYALFEKYRDPSRKRIFRFYSEYATAQAFNAAVNKGLKRIALNLKIKDELSSYYARHSFATIARNKCGVSMLDVHEALNHASEGDMRVTDMYVEKDWSVIDSVQRKVVNTIKEKALKKVSDKI